jgi:ABC-type transport system involved in multi-copper enzyme maturation permease subunit
MPIHDLGYRHWRGDWTSHPYRWWVITRQGISLLIQKKRFLLLMVLSSIPFLVRTVMIYLNTMMGNLPFLKIEAQFFEDFLNQQTFFVFIISIYAGSGLIANDLKANALQIYLSKPITRDDYFLGKLGVVVFFLSLPTLVPGLLLFLMAVLFKSDTTFLQNNYWVLGSIVAYSLLIIFTYALLILALSSLSKSSRFAGIGFAAVFFFSQILSHILFGILRTNNVGWVSVGNDLARMGDFLFGTPSLRFTPPLWSAVIVLAVVLAGSVWLIHRNVRAVEVVK